MNNNLPYQQIDFVLFYIKSIPDKHYTINGIFDNILNNKERKAKLDELQINRVLYDNIIQQLLKDEYIVIPNKEQLMIFLTFKGLLFNGYEDEQKSLNAQKGRVIWLEDQQLKNSKNLNSLTLILAIGTVFLVLVEIIHLLIEHKPFSCR